MTATAEEVGAEYAQAADVTDAEQVRDLIARTADALGGIDFLVNNAGGAHPGTFETLSDEDWVADVDVKLFSLIRCSREVLPHLRAAGGGRIVNIGAVYSRYPDPTFFATSVNRAAGNSFTKTLALEVAKDNILVTTVCPGLMRTGSPRNAWFKGQHREEFAWFSISDSLPLVTMAATRAARRILEACRHGDAELIMPLSTAVAVKLNALFPGVGADVMSLAERVLPGPGGIGTGMRRGAESESRWAPSVLTRLGDRAAERNNEVVAPET